VTLLSVGRVWSRSEGGKTGGAANRSHSTKEQSEATGIKLEEFEAGRWPCFVFFVGGPSLTRTFKLAKNVCHAKLVPVSDERNASGFVPLQGRPLWSPCSPQTFYQSGHGHQVPKRVDH
jgi:hypothetical protein